MNKVYWITGLSGSGKTTIGSALYSELKKLNENVILLDGDVLRRIFGDKYGYSKEDRLSLGTTYSKLCKMLSDQGFTVICCTIAMFDAIRDWNRKNIPDYVEVYLKVPIEVLCTRDQKGLYSGVTAGNIFDLVGMDIKMEEPKNPDIILNNDGSFSVSECVNRILEYKSDAEFYADKTYWDSYYERISDSTEIDFPSLFAEYIADNFLEKNRSIVDLGCGNGRDSLLFVQMNLHVTAVDGSETAVYNLKRKYGWGNKISFLCSDFVDSPSIYNKLYNYFYSRFSIHSINECKQSILLKNIYDHLEDNGYLFIEARGINDDLYGKGVMVERNAFFHDNHYRRFLVKDEIDEQLISLGFKIILSEEKSGFAPFGEFDPIVIRIVAQKL